MDKDKLTDRIDLTEEKTENINDPQASSHFKRIFEEDGKILEKEALASSYEVDEERKEALRLRILEAAAAQGLLDDEDVEVRDAAGSGNTAVEAEVAESAEDKEGKKRKKTRKRSYSSMIRWAAVLALVCLGVLGASVTSQAKGSGLWSTIQRLIGVETRWEQENNGEDRTYTSPEEFKAIGQIKDELGIVVPDFFYWPEGVLFSDVEIFPDINSFIMLYQKDKESIFLEGYGNGQSVSVVKAWEGDSYSYTAEYGGTTYSITKIINNNTQTGYYVSWKINEVEFVLSGSFNENEMEKILKNIKN